MSVVLSLAAMFAGIILVGSAAVYVHDAFERRRLGRRIGEQGVGGGGTLVYRSAARFGEPRSTPRSGHVVWVRAGGHAADGSGADPSRAGRRQTAGGAGRVTPR